METYQATVILLLQPAGFKKQSTQKVLFLQKYTKIAKSSLLRDFLHTRREEKAFKKR